MRTTKPCKRRRVQKKVHVLDCLYCSEPLQWSSTASRQAEISRPPSSVTASRGCWDTGLMSTYRMLISGGHVCIPKTLVELRLSRGSCLTVDDIRPNTGFVRRMVPIAGSVTSSI